MSENQEMTAAATPERGRRKERIGKVESDKMKERVVGGN